MAGPHEYKRNRGIKLKAHVVYVAVLEDILTIAGRTGILSGDQFTIAGENANFTHIGNVIEMSGEHFGRFQDALFGNEASRHENNRLEQKLAFYFGQLCRRGTACAIGEIPSEEAGEYLDAFIIRNFYLASKHGEPPELSLVMRSLVKKAIVKMHTFKPGYEDIWTWLKRLYACRTAYDCEVDELAEVVLSPQTDKEMIYVIDPSFYDDCDLLVEIAYKLRAGETVEKDVIDSALQSEQRSLYGKALKNSYALVAEGWAHIKEAKKL